MTLIELMVGVAIVAITLMFGIPSFAGWLMNARIRSTAEVLQNGLQFARAEAVRRDTPVRFQLVDTLTNSCVLSAAGPYWVVNLTASATPAGACANAVSDATSPYLLSLSPVVSSAVVTSLAGSRAAIGFDGLGRLTAIANPASGIGTLTIKVTSSSASCIASGGTARCLNVVVSPAGEVRMCDPSRATSSANDPLSCPA
jgi:type IV fimbrial biogenesis protein FimT